MSKTLLMMMTTTLLFSFTSIQPTNAFAFQTFSSAFCVRTFTKLSLISPSSSSSNSNSPSSSSSSSPLSLSTSTTQAYPPSHLPQKQTQQLRSSKSINIETHIPHPSRESLYEAVKLKTFLEGESGVDGGGGGGGGYRDVYFDLIHSDGRGSSRGGSTKVKSSSVVQAVYLQVRGEDASSSSSSSSSTSTPASTNNGNNNNNSNTRNSSGSTNKKLTIETLTSSMILSIRKLVNHPTSSTTSTSHSSDANTNADSEMERKKENEMNRILSNLSNDIAIYLYKRCGLDVPLFYGYTTKDYDDDENDVNRDENENENNNNDDDNDRFSSVKSLYEDDVAYDLTSLVSSSGGSSSSSSSSSSSGGGSEDSKVNEAADADGSSGGSSTSGSGRGEGGSMFDMLIKTSSSSSSSKLALGDDKFERRRWLQNVLDFDDEIRSKSDLDKSSGDGDGDARSSTDVTEDEVEMDDDIVTLVSGVLSNRVNLEVSKGKGIGEVSSHGKNHINNNNSNSDDGDGDGDGDDDGDSLNNVYTNKRNGYDLRRLRSFRRRFNDLYSDSAKNPTLSNENVNVNEIKQKLRSNSCSSSSSSNDGISARGGVGFLVDVLPGLLLCDYARFEEVGSVNGRSRSSAGSGVDGGTAPVADALRMGSSFDSSSSSSSSAASPDSDSEAEADSLNSDNDDDDDYSSQDTWTSLWSEVCILLGDVDGGKLKGHVQRFVHDLTHSPSPSSTMTMAMTNDQPSDEHESTVYDKGKDKDQDQDPKNVQPIPVRLQKHREREERKVKRALMVVMLIWLGFVQDGL